MKKEIRLRNPFDAHVHLRTGEVLQSVIDHTTSQFAGAVIMPNTQPDGITTAGLAGEYGKEISSSIKEKFWPFSLMMTIKLTPETTPEIIEEALKSGIKIVKLYPDGVTTGSQGGITDFARLNPIFETIQSHNMVLSIHGEFPKCKPFMSEVMFLGTLSGIAHKFPKMRIVMEHISSGESLEFIRSLNNVCGSITAHHMTLTWKDAFNSPTGKPENVIHPHNYCKPIPLREKDRKALIAAALSGEPKFFFGSDSAPHLKEFKECKKPTAGIFSAPTALCTLAEIFENYNRINELKRFVCDNAAAFYEIRLPEKIVTLENRNWKVPDEYDGIVPFRAGETISWKIAK